MLDVVIVGGGPAGLAASIYARRARLQAVTLEREAAGGQILKTYEIDNYPGMPGISGIELGEKLRQHADTLGCLIKCEDVKSIQALDTGFRVVTDAAEYEAANVILATGAGPRRLGVPGEEELGGAGVSYCATCDGAFYKNSVVAVAGGGDVAVEDAIYLARMAEKVYLIHRRDSLRAQQALQDTLMSFDNVEVIWDSQITSVNGVEDGEVSSVNLKNLKTQNESELAVDGIFVAIGNDPQTSLVRELLETVEGGYIKTDEECRTSCRGLYVCGDIRDKKLRQIVTAVSDGAVAVDSIVRNLKK